MALKKMKMNYENPHLFGPKEKIKLLVDHYDILLEADKNRKENRTGKAEICRM